MLTGIRLQDFRSYRDASFEFSEGINIIVGLNASGKTNLLEAVLVAARGSSYRAKDIELIYMGAAWSRLDVAVERGTRVVKLEKQNDLTAKKSFEINKQPFGRLSLQKSLPVVLFEPNHLLLLTGPPEARRNYIDDILEQVVSGYGMVRRAYRRVLAQRNALLKQGFGSVGPQVFVWNLRLSELGGEIARERSRLIEEINKTAAKEYRGLSHAIAQVELRYRSEHPTDYYETSLLKRLESNLEEDCLRGFTSVGPHRDDMDVLLNQQPAGITASRGETRSLVLVLKIIELQLLARVRGTPPLLLLDDVFSEAHGRRRQALTTHLKHYQTFITTTDADLVSRSFTRATNIISLLKTGGDQGVFVQRTNPEKS